MGRRSPEYSQSASARPKRVLIAEDEDIFRSKIESMLRAEGYEVTAVSNGREARDVFCIDPFDLVISDISMPGSDIDGNQLLDFIKEKNSDVKVILVTGYKYPDDFEKIAASPPDGLLAKPFRREELKESILRCLAQAPGTRKTLLRPAEIRALKEFSGELSGTLSPCELLVASGDGTYEVLCAKDETMPVEKIQSLRRLGIQVWARAATDPAG